MWVVHVAKEPIRWEDTNELLNAEGWIVLNQKPLQIKNAQGVVVEAEEAKYIVDDILWDYNN